MNRALACLLPLLLLGCPSDPAPEPTPAATPAPKPSEPSSAEAPVTPRVSYSGRIYVGNVGGGLSPRVIRTQADYERFVSALPQRKIQKKRPAPPSDDPLLALPKIDFSQEILIVALRDSMYVHPELGPIVAKGDDLEVQVVYPPLGDTVMAAAMHGVGVYAAVVVPSCPGEVRFSEDGERGEVEREPFPR